MTDPIPPSTPSSSSGRKAALWSGVGLVVAITAGGALYFRAGHKAGAHDHGEHEATRAPRDAKPSVSPEVLRHTDRAARAAATGELKRARESLGEALMLAPRHAPALLVHVCLALEEGNDAEAGTALEQLKAVAPGSTEVALLETLRELRRAPGAPWQQSFRDAWAKQGRPDFTKSELLPGATPLPPDPVEVEREKATWEKTTSADVKLMLALSQRKVDADQARFLLHQLPRLESPDLFLAVMDTLKGEALPESEHDRARKTFHEKLVSLAAAHPSSMQLQLLLLLGDTESGTELKAAEIDALERLATLPVWRETSFRDSYQHARQLLKEAGVSDANAMAMSVASRGLNDRGSWILRTRNVGTRGALSPEGRKRLGRITRDIGASLARQPTVLEQLVGLQLMRGGFQDMEDEAGRALAQTRTRELEDTIASFQRTAMARWPLFSLTEELMEENTRDELAYLKSFAAPAPTGTARSAP